MAEETRKHPRNEPTDTSSRDNYFNRLVDEILVILGIKYNQYKAELAKIRYISR